jgi:hypothetical protein
LEPPPRKNFPASPRKTPSPLTVMEERVGKSFVAELPKDVIGAHALRHLQKVRLRKVSLQAYERLHIL